MRTGKATARKTEPEEFAYALPGGPMFWQAEAWVLHSGPEPLTKSLVDSSQLRITKSTASQLAKTSWASATLRQEYPSALAEQFLFTRLVMLPMIVLQRTGRADATRVCA
eukprot:s3127_g9.t1